MVERIGLVLFFVAAFISSSAQGGTVYKCKGPDGGVVFSDTQCGTDATAVATFGQKKVPDPFWCSQGSAPQSLVDQCLDAWRPGLRDPRAGYADGGLLVTHGRTGKRSIFVDGHARNGFGGFNGILMECDLSGDDAIDQVGTAEWVKLYGAFSRLDIDRTPHDVRVCEK